jgi:hypothetical protein
MRQSGNPPSTTEFGPLRKIEEPKDEMDRTVDFALYVTTVRSGPKEWMLYCVEHDYTTGRLNVLDHTQRPVRIEQFMADKKSQEVAA